MHGDEAVQAYKFGELLDEHRYQYDRHEYHGPTLPYLTLLPAWLSRAGSFVELNESDLRSGPLLFGILLVLGLLVMADGLGRLAAVFAALLTAISPAMVFYSRYYIHEMLLVCFSFGVIACGYRYLRDGKVLWAVLTGAFAGMMHATKETCIIAFASMGAAGAALLFMRKEKGRSIWTGLQTPRTSHLLWAGGAALALSTLFYSSFFTHPKGVLDSFLAYETYLKRGSAPSLHDHPWFFYLGLLSFYRYADGPLYSEALVGLLALVGLGVAFTRNRMAKRSNTLLRFLGIYTLLMIAVYSAIPYKTPWCLLGFFHGMILLAGVGAACLVRLTPKPLAVGLGAVLALGLGHLAWQAYTSSFIFHADSRNPYVYAHTGTDIFRIVNRVKQMAAVHPDMGKMRIQVICPNADYWPLPWYLRGYHVEYANQIPEKTRPAPLILIHPTVEPALMRVLYELPEPGQKELYMHLFYEDGQRLHMQLRPGIEIRGFVAKSLWDRYLEAGSHEASDPNLTLNSPRPQTAPNPPGAETLRQD